MLRSNFSLFSLVMLTCMSSQAYAGYTITKLESTSAADIADLVDEQAAINNNGDVAFKVEDAGGNEDLYVIPNAGSLTKLVDDGNFDSFPVIGDSGNVFIGLTSGGDTGIFNASTSAFLINDATSSVNDFSQVSVNASDVGVFVGNYGGGNVEVNTALPLTTIEDNSGLLTGFTLTDINDSGVVTYVAETATDPEIYISTSGTAIDTMVNFFSAAINNNNTVAYNDNATVKTNTAVVVDNTTDIGGGTTFASFNRIGINNHDDIAILGAVGTQQAIYVRKSNGDYEKIVDMNVDATLNGETLYGVNMGPHSINDAGQVVFWALTLVTSPALALVEGIYVATPDSPPLIPGDINVDGVVDLADNLLLTQFLVGIKTPTAAEEAAGDMNTDATLNLGDLILHTQLILP